jgi:hypothetical protein
LKKSNCTQPIDRPDGIDFLYRTYEQSGFALSGGHKHSLELLHGPVPHGVASLLNWT